MKGITVKLPEATLQRLRQEARAIINPYHAWSVALMKQIRPPLLVCDAVLTEVAYFLRDDGVSVEPLFALIERAVLRSCQDPFDRLIVAHAPAADALLLTADESIRQECSQARWSS